MSFNPMLDHNVEWEEREILGGVSSSQHSNVSCANGPYPRHFASDKSRFWHVLNVGHQSLWIEEPDLHVRRNFGDDYFFEGGAGYPDYLAEGHFLREHGTRYAQMLRQHTPVGRVLDVGCAAGFILAGFQGCGWVCSGIEPNSRMASYGRTALGLDVEEGTLEDVNETEAFDLVSMIQVLAHFVDPRVAIERAYRLVAPNGLLLIETWDRESRTARLFGRRWHEYSPPSVVHWFSRSGVVRLAQSVGFSPIASGRPKKYIGGAHAKSLLASKIGTGVIGRSLNIMLSAVPDDMRIPYPAEDLFWLVLRRDPRI